MNKRKAGQSSPGVVGTLGEDAIINLLTNRFGTVEDLRKVHYFQMRDIDLRVTSTGVTFEVKTDTWIHETGNMVFELTRDHGGPGCFYRSKADYWVYVVAETGDAYIFELSHLQAWLSMNPLKANIRKMRAHRNGQFVTYIGAMPKLVDVLADVKHEVLTLSLAGV